MILKNRFTRLLVVGLMLLSTLAVGMPAYAQIEVDFYPHFTAAVTMGLPDGGELTVNLSGPMQMEVVIGPGGEADDSDGDGLDEVMTEIVQMDLTGNSIMGPVTVRQSPTRPSLGELEEKVNSQSGRLDVRPFAPDGICESFFDVFFEIEIGGMILHNETPARLHGIIDYKPPSDALHMSFHDPIPLLDPNGNPTGVSLLLEAFWTPDIEVDNFPDSAARVTIRLPDGSEVTADLRGPTRVEVEIGANGEGNDSDGDGLDDFPTEMVQMDLTGVSTMGPVTVRQSPSMRSQGEIEEMVNNTPGILDIPPFTPGGTADSFFDVFFEIEIGGMVLHNVIPLRMSAVIDHKPPDAGTAYIGPPEPIPLVDENGDPTGVSLVSESHTPVPDGEGNGQGPPVGGDIYPVNKTALLAPWIILAVAIITGAAIVVRRRQSRS